MTCQLHVPATERALTTDALSDAFELTIDGVSYPAAGSFGVVNPATGEAFAEAPATDQAGLDAAFTSADRAYRTWRGDEAARRAGLLAAASAIEACTEELAPVLTAEQGQPLDSARMEFRLSAAWLRYYAGLDLPREVIRDDAQAYEQVVRKPLGVVAAITPWNVPVALAMWKIAPALRAGNTVVVKPSPYTPLTTLALGRVLRGVLPDGVLNVVAGPDPLGAQLVAHPVPRKISFTGSTATGKKVAVSAAGDLKRVTLELGGNDPAILLDDIDVDKVAQSLFWSAFRNSGQVCLAVKRVYAHQSVHARLVDALADIARSVKVGAGADEGVQLGPLQNKPQFERVAGLVRDAVGRGGRAVAGGEPLPGSGYFYAPTILDRVDDGAPIVAEEQFGPALPVLPFSDEAEVLNRANSSHYGLTASVWSGDPERALAFAAGVDAGQVAVNGHGRGVLPHLPFGGHKWSGIGVENGPWGLYGFTELQVLAAPSRHLAREASS